MLAKRNFVLAVRGDIFGDKPNCLQTLRVHLETIVALVVAVVRNLEQRQRVILQKANIIIILMMMDMTISIWMGITTTTDMIETVIMQMAWMMRWMSTEKTGNADKDLQKGAHYGRTLFYNSRLQSLFWQ